MSRLLMFLMLAAWLTVGLGGPARAAPYWIAYEGNDFPENEGWERRFGDENGAWHGGAERSLEDGTLVLNSLRHQLIHDSYEFGRTLNPDAGELFVAEWRVRITENYGSHDAGVTIARDGMGTLSFRYYVDQIVSTREDWSLPITPQEWHEYRLESWDMLTYTLWIDEDTARTGVWDLDSINESYVAFGDATHGGGTTSLTEWDYVRFGVIPEPSGVLLSTTGLLLVLRTMRHRW